MPDEITPEVIQSPVSQSIEPITMDFGEAMRAAAAGKKIRRLAWPDDGTYIAVINEVLHLFKPQTSQFHVLKVSSGDIMGEDWVIVTKGFVEN